MRRVLENKILQLSRDGLSTARKNGFARVDADFHEDCLEFKNSKSSLSNLRCSSFYDEMIVEGERGE